MTSLFRIFKCCSFFVVAIVASFSIHAGEEGSIVFQFDGKKRKAKNFEFYFLNEKSREIVEVEPSEKGTSRSLSLGEGQHRLLAIRFVNAFEDFYFCPPSVCTYEVKAGRTLYVGEFSLSFKGVGSVVFPYRAQFTIRDRSKEASASLHFPNESDVLAIDIKEVNQSLLMRDLPSPAKVDASTSLSELEDKGVVAVRLSSSVNRANFGGSVASSVLMKMRITGFYMKIAEDGGRNFSIGMPIKLLGKRKDAASPEGESYMLLFALPPGDYSVRDLITEFGAAGAAGFNVPLGMDFKVEAGRISYLGQIEAEPVKNKLLGVDTEARSRFFLTDDWEVDQQALFEKVPFMKDWPVDAQPLGPVPFFYPAIAKVSRGH